MNTLRTRYRRLAESSRQKHPLSFPTLLWLFIAGSLMGFVMEGVWHLLRTGAWGFRVATLWGPFCIIYGAGAVVMYLIALRVEGKRHLRQFLAFALAGSAVEYLSSLFQEAAFGTVSWDYSHHPFNLGGRISLRMTLLWGVCGMALMYLLLPVALSVFNCLQLGSRPLLCRAAAAFMCVNLLWTGVALLRWQERVSTAAPAGNAVEAWMDHRWPDERMRERFPNMVFPHADDASSPVPSDPEGTFLCLSCKKDAGNAYSDANGGCIQGKPVVN